jgi:hypothetical protein
VVNGSPIYQHFAGIDYLYERGGHWLISDKIGLQARKEHFLFSQLYPKAGIYFSEKFSNNTKTSVLGGNVGMFDFFYFD